MQFVGIIIAAAAAGWVYKDSQEKGVDNGVLYAVLTFLLLIIGLPVYLIVRSKHMKAVAMGNGPGGQLPG
ncbi:hypothetical protein G6O69_22965 [Pseudenhygromyxa sp. WMMC2535]|uniref:hypothetical protein n=1 Tax=Pseudenhygromyxa sp. WMMC2535 TaxID=2712867 RepID=UPI0015580FB5|nr:hypothetical protein [Pseudenhygromyxa sp. WMMC2535]NVB40719.1 hypothetical protein [Pseudenhygromyxa sp. WMMC2535]